MAAPNLANPSQVTPGLLAAATVAAVGWVTLITPTAGQAMQLVAGTLSNASAVDVHVSVAIAPAGFDPTDGAHSVIPDYTLVAGGVLSLKEFIGECWLGEGDQLAVSVDTADAVLVLISGLTAT